MKSAIFSFSLLIPVVTFAQSFDANARTTGYIKSTTGKYEGVIDVNPALDQVLWTKDNETKIFGAKQIKEVRVQTDQGKTLYYGLELAGDHYLFEVITTGKVEILYRDSILKSRYDDSYYPPFFILGKRKELISLEREKDFFDAFGNDDKWMKQYIKNNNLSLAKKEDIKHAFSYYNSQYEIINP